MSQSGRGSWRKRSAQDDHQHALSRETQAGASSMNGRWPPVAHGATAVTSASPAPAAYAQMCITPDSVDDSTPNRAGTAYAHMCITPDSGDGPGGSASSGNPGSSRAGKFFEAYRSYRAVTPSDVRRARARSPADDASKLCDLDFAAESEVLSQISRGLDSDPTFQSHLRSGEWSFDGSDDEDNDGNDEVSDVEDDGDDKESEVSFKVDEDGEGDEASSAPPTERGKRAAAKGACRMTGAKHLKAVETSFMGFRCRCATRRAGQLSCLEQFTRAQLREIHHETYGLASSDSVDQIRKSIHQRYWSLATKLPGGIPDSIGRTYKVKSLSLNGEVICAESFRMAVGGARRAHVDMMSLVLRGFSPLSLTSSQ